MLFVESFGIGLCRPKECYINSRHITFVCFSQLSIIPVGRTKETGCCCTQIVFSEYIAKQLVIAAALVGAAGVAMALGVIVKEHRAYLMKQAENCANNLSGACEKCGYGKEEDMAKVP
eukprot:GHVS01069132.1.p1 GENE.GHVS01069132.1~~GHVS01069132.1.p1  ORF type:complete len:118 (-),score=7.53 GHVS01069132.1:326-679(-)